MNQRATAIEIWWHILSSDPQRGSLPASGHESKVQVEQDHSSNGVEDGVIACINSFLAVVANFSFDMEERIEHKKNEKNEPVKSDLHLIKSFVIQHCRMFYGHDSHSLRPIDSIFG